MERTFGHCMATVFTGEIAFQWSEHYVGLPDV